jgi:hypothetical protein
MWSSWVKRKGTIQVMYIAKLKDDPKRVKKTISMTLERVFEKVWRGRKWNHIKKDFWSWSAFLVLKYWLPLYLKRLLELFFFFLLFFFFFYGLSLGGFNDIWGEKSLLQKLFFQMAWHGMVMSIDILVVDAYSGMELCMPIWLNHDYADVGVVDILAVDTYSGVEVCMPIFLGEASK